MRGQYYLLADRYPWPPHRSLVTETTSSSSQEASGLMAQHMVTTSGCSDPSSAWKAHLKIGTCDWSGHGHVTSMLASDWSREVT